MTQGQRQNKCTSTELCLMFGWLKNLLVHFLKQPAEQHPVSFFCIQGSLKGWAMCSLRCFFQLNPQEVNFAGIYIFIALKIKEGRHFFCRTCHWNVQHNWKKLRLAHNWPYSEIYAGYKVHTGKYWTYLYKAHKWPSWNSNLEQMSIQISFHRHAASKRS